MPRAHTALIIYLSIRLLLVTLCRFLLTLQRLQMTIFLLAVVQILFRLAKVWGNIIQRENDSRDNFILFTIGLNYMYRLRSKGSDRAGDTILLLGELHPSF